MRSGWRWTVVGAVLAALVALPFAAHLLPAGSSDVSARTLFARIRGSAPVAYSGYATTAGGVGLPSGTFAFSPISDLFGSDNQLRVWWRGPQDWRVDNLTATGETDLHRDTGGLWTWSFEDRDAERSSIPRVVRYPRADDLVPGNLARRLLSEADPADVTRLPSARVAGHEAAGLRIRVTDPRSTLRYIDVWALPDSGLPVRVAVYGTQARPIVSTSMLDLSLGMPSAATVGFRPTNGVPVVSGRFGDLLGIIGEFGRGTPPATLGGLARRTDLRLGAVGVYGSGVTELVAVPLPGRAADELLSALHTSPTLRERPSGISARSGPINLQLAPANDFGDRWLLLGTVTRPTLTAALAQLPRLAFDFPDRVGAGVRPPGPP